MFQMEYWLKRDGQFIHPNAVRYFLYQLQKASEEKMDELNKRMEEERQTCDKCDRYEVANEWKRKRIVKLKQESKDFENAYEALYQYVKDQVYERLLEKCQNYIKRLSENYEAFYDSFEEMRMVFSEEKELCMNELDRYKGISKSYVCADKQCRKVIFTEIRKRPEYYQAGSALSYEIYQLMHETIENGMQRKQHFRAIEKYWLEDMESKFKDIIDMNILHAMDKEEMCKYRRHLTSEGMVDRIKQVRKILIDPFLQYYKKAGEEQGISICCYNSSLNGEHGEYLKAVRWLQEHEGVDDEFYCDSYRVIFYRSFVGLNAGKVLEYLHWERKNRFKRKGRAFRFYEQTLIDMGKGEKGKSQITPHLDKNWHSLLQIPDTDARYQHEVEINIGIAFLYGVLAHLIRKDESNRKYLFLFDDAVNIKYDSLFDVHSYLYFNLQAYKRLSDRMNREIEQDNLNGENRFMERIKSYQGGIFQILIDYNVELPVGRQDKLLNSFLIEAVSAIFDICIERDTKDVSEKKQKLLQEEWKRCTKREEYKDRVKMVLEQIKSYMESNNQDKN